MILTLVGDIVIDRHGHDAWDDVLSQSQSSGAYTSLGVYPDDELPRLVRAMAQQFGQSPRLVMQHVGRLLIDELAKAHPEMMAAASLPDLLEGLTERVHGKVRLQYPSAQPPLFTMVERTETSMLVRYQSPRLMCHLAEGMILGAAEQRGVEATVVQERCALVDARHCDLAVAW